MLTSDIRHYRGQATHTGAQLSPLITVNILKWGPENRLLSGFSSNESLWLCAVLWEDVTNFLPMTWLTLMTPRCHPWSPDDHKSPCSDAAQTNIRSWHTLTTPAILLWVSWVWRSITTLHNEAQHPSWECWLWRMSAASDGSAVTMCSEYPALMSTMSWQLCFELNTQQSIHGGYQHWHSAYSVFTDNNLNTNILFIKSQTPSQIFSLFIHHNNSMFEQH